ncbi:TetR/AcrR family transcriptional regulator [Saccharopolyspora sp. CA-218241]|uniref:TetR/AcrR family transcriptional regulator n=1 Tax=Saccharopolyspora sp. CA-218241 TaxID=3240027 RepID=UPI003D96386C
MPSTRRRDATHNRERLIDAARRSFAALGPDAPLEGIAQGAGVSRTTLHRHFETRQDLAAAVLERNVADIEARAASLTGTDDGAVTLFHHLLDMQANAPWLARVVAADESTGVGALADRTAAAMEPLVERARMRGIMHPELGTQDLLLTLPMALAGQAAGEHSASPHRSDHLRAILHRGLFTTDPPRSRPVAGP